MTIETINPYSLRNIALDSTYTNKELIKLGIGKIYIAQISRFDSYCGVEELIDTYNKIYKNEKKIEFIIAGHINENNKNEIDIFKTLTKKAKGVRTKIIRLSNNVNLCKIQINALQKHANLVIFNYKENGFRVSLAETMYKGGLVLVRSFKDSTPIIKHAENGFTFENDINLYDAIMSVPTYAKQEWDRIRNNARQTIIDNFIEKEVKNEHNTMV